VRVTRRGFLGTVGVVAGIAAGTGLYTWQVEPNWPVVVQRQLPVRALPARLVGRTLVQISDTHVGPSVEDSYLVDVFRQVASLRPDIVVVTGDLVSYHADIYSQLEAVYRHFPRGRMATFAILGNHDYGPDWAHPEVAQRIADIVAGFGVTVLRNQIHDVAAFRLSASTTCGQTECPGHPSAVLTIPVLRSYSPIVQTPPTCPSGTDSKDGFLPATRTVDSASRRSYRRRWYPCATRGTPPASLC
jgi:Calcineurin-like phosphoesterase